eukprot:scaffold285410_cov39-Tisochrysis_lutea.AAC.1
MARPPSRPCAPVAGVVPEPICGYVGFRADCNAPSRPELRTRGCTGGYPPIGGAVPVSPEDAMCCGACV